MKDKLSGTYPIATATTVELFDQNINCGRLDSFTFDKQKKFGYIEIIFKHIEDNIQSFAEVWPFLGAYTFNGAWDPNIDEDLEFIGITHYTILKSFSYVFQNKDSVSMNDPSQRFKNIIFHYALIIDCIKQISFHILKFKNKLNPESQPLIPRLRKESFLKRMDKWYDDYYNDRFESFLNSGGIIMNEIHSSKNFLSSISKGRNFRSYHKFNEIITPYRNVFIHNPSIDIFHRGRDPFVVSSKYIKNSRTIQSISKLERKDLINPKVLMDELFNKSTRMLSDVWTTFSCELETINTDPNFPNQRFRKN
jgi:hypothetical protein